MFGLGDALPRVPLIVATVRINQAPALGGDYYQHLSLASSPFSGYAASASRALSRCIYYHS